MKGLENTEENGFNISVEWKKVDYRRWRKVTTLEAKEKWVDLRKGGLWNIDRPLKSKTVKV